MVQVCEVHSVLRFVGLREEKGDRSEKLEVSSSAEGVMVTVARVQAVAVHGGNHCIL